MKKEKKSRPEFKKIVLITGAAQGIGLATAEFLASVGYLVYAGIRSASNPEKLNACKKKYPGHLKSVICDVTDEGSIQKACDSILQEVGTIDILINNACLVYWGTSEVCTLNEQQRSMDVNYFGIVRMLQRVLPIMRSNKSGRIINMSSVSGFEAYPSIETYVATKFAVEGLSESLSIYLRHWNIHVSLVEPGNVKTDVAQHSAIGSRVVKDTPHLNHFSERIFQVAKESYSTAQDPLEIAQLIRAICESPHPHFRYQTSESSKKRASFRFIDPTGNQSIIEKTQLLKDRDLKIMFEAGGD